ncbi:MAG: hypothetical protein WCF16_12615 [Alphaproteobacteria bacterium]
MPRVTPALTTFNGGEWSPELYGRIDLAKYPNACRRLENFVPVPQGSAKRRSGTRFVAETKDSGAARLIPFEFSTVQTYQIEAGAGYFRFYKDRGRIESPPGTPVEIASPYAQSDLAGVKWAQSADVLYLCHPSFVPRKLSRTSHTTWTLTVLDALDGPYQDQNSDTAKTLTPSAASGSGITITAAGHTPFSATDVGRLVRIKHGSTWGYAKIAAFTDSSHVTADVKSNFGGVSAASDWRLGAWSDTTEYPSVVTFYEERLFFAGSSSQPQTLWGSVSGDFENFAPSDTTDVVAADSAVTYTIADDRVNAIRWMSAGKVLSVGTTGAEFTVQASTLNEALTPTNVTVRRETTRGSADALAVRVNQAVLFTQRAGRKLFESVFAFDADSFVAQELSLLANHISRKGIVEIAYQAEPWSIVWAALSDGRLAGMTYMRDQQVVGWHVHPLGGTNAKVLSVSCIPGMTQDELWMVVERTVNGATRRHAEFMEYDFLPLDADDKSGAFFVDAGLTYSGPPATVISGLDHLEGETVAVLADGANHPDKRVAGGAITLDREARVVQAGLSYTSRIETMDLEAGAQDGASIGRRKRIDRATVRFLDTLGAKVGFDDAHLDEVLFRGGANPMDDSPPLFTGDKQVIFPKGWDNSARVVVTQDQPLPCTVSAIVPRISINEG